MATASRLNMKNEKKFLFVNGNSFIARDDTTSCTLTMKFKLLKITVVPLKNIMFFLFVFGDC